MACSGSHCTGHMITTFPFGGCVGHRFSSSPRPGSAISFTKSPGSFITTADIQALRNQIKLEVDRWRQHASYSSTLPAMANHTYTADSDKVAAHFNDIDNHMRRESSSNLVGNRSQGQVITSSSFGLLVDEYNAMRNDCICNSNVVPTCNSVCGCHNDCGCHYSDKRLKREISYC